MIDKRLTGRLIESGKQARREFISITDRNEILVRVVRAAKSIEELDVRLGIRVHGRALISCNWETHIVMCVTKQ